MKSLEQIAKEYESQTLDGRDIARLVQFIPFDMLSEFGLSPEEEFNSAEKWNANVKAFTRENILEQLKDDVVRMWNWVLEEGLEDFDDYAQYGLPLFKATAVKYGFPNPIGGMDGDEFIFSIESDEYF